MRYLTLALAALLAGCAAGASKGVERGLVYVHRPGQDLHADVYTPEGDGPFPGMLVVHGGSWQRGDKDRMAEVAERLARRGYVAVSIDYRLAPEHHFPAQLYDCQAALRWIRANAAKLHVDPKRIGGFGYSAGAHLVGMLATTDASDGLDEAVDTNEGDTRLQAAVLGAAPIDLRLFRPNRTFDRFLGVSLDERPDVYAMASPITFVSPDDPPMFLYHGATDWWVDASQSRLMLDALHQVGVPAAYYETSGGHFATFLFDDDQIGKAIDFLDRWL